MSSETLSYFFKNEDIKLKARFQVALQCAPFLKGLKISSVITMEQKMCEELQEIFEETEVEYRILSCRDSRCLVFFFRRSELEYHLMMPDNWCLRHLGIICCLDENQLAAWHMGIICRIWMRCSKTEADKQQKTGISP